MTYGPSVGLSVVFSVGLSDFQKLAFLRLVWQSIFKRHRSKPLDSIYFAQPLTSIDVNMTIVKIVMGLYGS